MDQLNSDESLNKIFLCRRTILLLLMYAIQSICAGMAFYITIFLKNQTHLTALCISSIISASSVGNILGSYLAGYAADKFHPIYFLKGGLIIQGVALFIMIFLTHFYLIFFMMGIMGIGSSLYITSSNFILISKFNIDERNRATIISLQHIISNIGMFISAIIMGYCAEGYSTYIFTFISLLVVTLAVTCKTFPQSFYNLGFQKKNSVILPALCGPYYFIIGLSGVATLGLMYAQHKIAFPLFLETNFGNISTGYLMAMNPLIIILFQSSIIRKSASFNPVFLLILGLLLFAFSFFLINHKIVLSLVLISYIFMTIGEILVTTFAQSIAFGYAPDNYKGRILGLYKSVYSTSMIAGYYFGGFILEYSTYQLVWNFSIITGILGCLVIIFFEIILKDNKEVIPRKF